MIRKLACALMICLSFTGCFDMVEEITLNADGSGMIAMHMDASRVMGMVRGLSPSGEAAIPGMNSEKPIKDSIISLKPDIDTSTVLTAQQKQLLSRGYVRLNTDPAANKMQMAITYPFSSLDELTIIYAALGSNNPMTQDPGMAKALEKTAYGKILSLASGNAYQFMAGRGKMERRFTGADSIVLRTGTDEAQTGGAMPSFASMLKFSLNTVLHLPSPAKSYSGGKSISVSPDKRTIEIRHFGLDTKELKASELAYSVTY